MSYAEQMEWPHFQAEGRGRDVLHGLQAAAAAHPLSKSPTSRECRVEDPAQVTSGSVPHIPDWPPFMLQWKQEQQAYWPLRAANAAQLFAGDPDCSAIVRWLQQGLPQQQPGHVLPAFDCANYPVQPSLAAYTAAAATRKLAERHVCCAAAWRALALLARDCIRAKGRAAFMTLRPSGTCHGSS